MVFQAILRLLHEHVVVGGGGWWEERGEKGRRRREESWYALSNETTLRREFFDFSPAHFVPYPSFGCGPSRSICSNLANC